MKKLCFVFFAFVTMLLCLVACDTSNANGENNEEVKGLISDYVECIVDVECDTIIERGYSSNYWYESEGTIDIDIRKFSNENLHFDNVSVELVIYLSDLYGAWRFEDSEDVEDWTITGQKMTKIIKLSTGGSANFSTKIYLDYNSTALMSIKNNIKKPSYVSVNIYKEDGRITKK